MPHYRIIGGHSFRDADGSIKTGGQLIELDEEQAQAHAGKLDPEPVAVDESPADQPAALSAQHSQD